VSVAAAATAAALAVAMAASAATGWWLRDVQAQAQLGALRTAHALQQVAQERQAREAGEAQRKAEAQIRLAINQEAIHARAQAAAQAARAADLRAVAGRLRQHVVALATAASPADGSAAAADGSPPAAGAGLVLAELYRGADEEAVELALAFDAARGAGLACERVYGALTAR